MMVSVKGAVAVTRFASVTWMMKLTAPLAVGVPPIAPVAGFSDNPAGREPPLSAQVYGTAPPVAFNVCAYFAETVPAGSGELVVMTRAALIEREKDLVAISPWLSLTWMLKFEAPAVVGVPGTTGTAAR